MEFYIKGFFGIIQDLYNGNMFLLVLINSVENEI